MDRDASGPPSRGHHGYSVFERIVGCLSGSSNRLGRQEEALASLDQALAERSDLILAREERGESLWRLGRRQAAAYGLLCIVAVLALSDAKLQRKLSEFRRKQAKAVLKAAPLKL